MSNKKITNLADETDFNDAVNFKQFFSLEDNVCLFDDKYIKQKVQIFGGVAVGYANMNLLPV